MEEVMETNQAVPDFLNKIKELVESNIDTNNKQLLLKLSNSSSSIDVIEVVERVSPLKNLRSCGSSYEDAWILSNKLALCGDLGKAIFYILLTSKVIYPGEISRHFTKNAGSVNHELKKLTDARLVEEIKDVYDQDVQYMINNFLGGTNAPRRSINFYRMKKDFLDNYHELLPRIMDLVRGSIKSQEVICNLGNFEHKKQNIRQSDDDLRKRRLEESKRRYQREDEEKRQREDILNKEVQDYYWSKLEFKDYDTKERKLLVKTLDEFNKVIQEAPEEILPRLLAFHRVQDLKEKLQLHENVQLCQN